jgi:membrane protein implicated in regulation of membrane protease activity
VPPSALADGRFDRGLYLLLLLLLLVVVVVVVVGRRWRRRLRDGARRRLAHDEGLRC